MLHFPKVLSPTLHVRFFISNISNAHLKITVAQMFYRKPYKSSSRLKYLITKIACKFFMSLMTHYYMILQMLLPFKSLITKKCLKNFRFGLFLFILSITSFTNQTHVKLYKPAKTHGYILISQWTCRDFNKPGSFSFKMWALKISSGPKRTVPAPIVVLQPWDYPIFAFLIKDRLISPLYGENIDTLI